MPSFFYVSPVAYVFKALISGAGQTVNVGFGSLFPAVFWQKAPIFFLRDVKNAKKTQQMHKNL